jgi:hypothetical protein
VHGVRMNAPSRGRHRDSERCVGAEREGSRWNTAKLCVKRSGES